MLSLEWVVAREPRSGRISAWEGVSERLAVPVLAGLGAVRKAARRSFGRTPQLRQNRSVASTPSPQAGQGCTVRVSCTVGSPSSGRRPGFRQASMDPGRSDVRGVMRWGSREAGQAGGSLRRRVVGVRSGRGDDSGAAAARRPACEASRRWLVSAMLGHHGRTATAGLTGCGAGGIVPRMQVSTLVGQW